MDSEILCSAKTSRKRATARAPLGQLPDFSTTMASVPTGPCAVVHATNQRAKGAGGDVLKGIHLKNSFWNRKLVPPSKTRLQLHWRDERASPNIQNHPFKNRSKKSQITVLLFSFGEWAGRLVIATRFLTPSKSLTAIV